MSERAIRHTAGWLAVLGMLGCTGQGNEAPGGLDDSEARESLARLAGCYSVRYEFVETGGPGDFFLDGNIEFIEVTAGEDSVTARNYLILEGQPRFLHWQQIWKPAGGDRWHLTVMDGEDQIRYESTGVWRFNQWEGEPALAAKPIRDSQRVDYDVLERRNIIQFTERGWVQSEVNMKLLADGTPVASEIGWIVYTRQPDDALCPSESLALLRASGVPGA